MNHSSSFDRASSIIKGALLALFCLSVIVGLIFTIDDARTKSAHDLSLDGTSCAQASPGDDMDAMGAARKPLVNIAGQNQTIPVADYLSSPGGMSVNATPVTGAGDMEVTTLNGLTPTVISGLTTNTLPKAGSATTIVNSAVTDNGTNIGLGAHASVAESTGTFTTSGDVSTTGSGRIVSATNVLAGGLLTIGNAGSLRKTFNVGAPTSASHGTISADSSNSMGSVVIVGSNTSTLVTFSGGAQPKQCWLQASAGTYTTPGYALTTDFTTPATMLVNCLKTSDNSAGNCPDFHYQCWF